MKPTVYTAMNTTKKIAVRRDAFTLIEMMVVIAIILALAALAAAFAPRVNENQKMTRAVDNLEQWLLTAKMRAKRDGLATGLRFIQAPGDAPGTYSQFQYIQQPEPLLGGVCVGGPPVPPPGTYQYPPLTGNYYKGGIITSAANGTVTFYSVFLNGEWQGVDFSLGGIPPVDAFGRQQWLVQTGDYLEINGGGVFSIWGVVVPATGSPANTLVLGGLYSPTPLASPPPYFSQQWNPAAPTMVVGTVGQTVIPPAPGPPQLWQSQYEQSLTIGAATTNYRIIRQPRILLGEEPLTLPNNYAVAVDLSNNNPAIPPTMTFTNIFNVLDFAVPPNTTCNVTSGPSGFPEILFSPTGAVIGANAGKATLWISVWDTTMQPLDANFVGIVGIQSRSGFIGAYGVSFSGDPLYFVRTARESGL